MVEAALLPTGLVRSASSRLPARTAAGTALAPASVPGRATSGSPRRSRGASASPLRPRAQRETAGAVASPSPSPRAISAAKGTPFRGEAAAPSLTRPHALRCRQPLGGKATGWPLFASVKFPGTTEEDRETDRPVATLVSPPEKGSESSEHEQDEEGYSPAPEPTSSLDRVERQAKESLAKLKHLLYKLKTRKEGDVSSTIITAPSYAEEPALVGDESQLFVSQKIQVDLSAPAEEAATDAPVEVLGVASPAESLPAAAAAPEARTVDLDLDLDLASLQKGLEFQLDALTATRATVTFDDASQTAVVTVTATVRAAQLEDKQSYSEKAIAMATRALARTCLELDGKANASALSNLSIDGAAAQAGPVSGSGSSLASSEAHQRVQRALLSGAVVSWRPASAEFGATPFRPVYAVQLQLLDGSLMDALFKPCLPGDRLLRWRRAPEDWVAYQLASSLGMDVVPPTVIRTGLKLGEREFDMGVLALKPQGLVRLESTDPSLAAGTPQTIVSDIRILDALLGNALRPKESFLASLGHWSEVGAGHTEGTHTGTQRFWPLILGQPLGPGCGRALHSMWSPVGASSSVPSVQVVSKETMSKLKGLNCGVLLTAFGGSLNAEEMEMILAKRDHLLAYFEGLARKQSWANVCL